MRESWQPWPTLTVIKIVKYIVASEEGGALGGAKILQKIMAPPLSVIKIVKYCVVGGGGGHWGRAIKSYKYNGAPSLSVRLLSIVAPGEGIWGAKILQKIMAPPLSVIEIVNIVASGKGGGALGRLKSNKS